jgi:hypothetical protein
VTLCGSTGLATGRGASTGGRDEGRVSPSSSGGTSTACMTFDARTASFTSSGRIVIWSARSIDTSDCCGTGLSGRGASPRPA